MEIKNNLVHSTRWFDEHITYYQKSSPHPYTNDNRNEGSPEKNSKGPALPGSQDLKDSGQTPVNSSSPRTSVRFLNHKTVEVHTVENPTGKTVNIEIHKSSYNTTDSSLPPFKNLSLKPHISLSRHHDRERAPLTLRNVLLDRTLNVENLAIGEFQEIHLEPTDPLFLPALRIISWHAESTDSNYGDIDSSEDEEEEQSKTKVCGCIPHKTRHHDQENQKKRHAILQILSSAPNLELIKDFNFETDYDLVIQSRKVHCVQHLILHDTVNTDHLMEFLESRPHVKVLQLISHPSDDADLKLHPEEMDRLAKALKLLFLLSCDSLGILDLTQFCSSLDLQIPHNLHKLHQLSLGNDSRGQIPSRVLPRQICLDKILTNLCVLDCSNLKTDEDSNWDLYFPTEDSQKGKLDSVKVLVLNDNCSFGWMEKVYGLCPNFTKLVVHSFYGGGGEKMNFMLRKVFRYWCHLHHIELRIDDFPRKISIDFSMDSAITGLTETTCKSLRMVAAGKESGRNPDELEYMGSIEKSLQPIRCSIANLQQLKTFDIIFEHECLGKLAARLPGPFDELAQDHCPFMSSISCRYGFSHVPGLKVSILFDQDCPWGKEIKKNLESMTCQFIRLWHRHDICCNLLDHHHEKHGTKSGGGLGVKLYCYP